MALAFALLALAVLTVVGVAVIIYTGANSRTTAHSRADKAAFSLAESGLNEAAAVLHGSADPLGQAAITETTTTHPEGSVTWSGTRSGDIWTLTATATVSNPTGPGAAPITRTVTEQHRVELVTVVSDNTAWGHLYADGPDCLPMEGSSTISEPLYVRGSICLEGRARITSTATPVSVLGTIETDGQATVGTASAPIAELHVGGGCRKGTSGSYVTPCGPSQSVYATYQDAVVPDVARPPLNLAWWYENAKPGPRWACTSASGSVPPFDNDGMLNRSLPGAIDLMPFTPYSCIVEVGSLVFGQLTWTPGSPGSLVVDGAIFFDGDIVMRAAPTALYSGRGTIYASGSITIEGSRKLCGAWDGDGCDWAAWDPNENLLAMVAGTSTDEYGFTLQSSSEFQGAVYAVTDYKREGSSISQGPVIANSFLLEGESAVGWNPTEILPEGAPGLHRLSIYRIPGTFSG